MRTSKIARLPQAIRNELNTRIDDGHFGSELLDWLNALPEVQAVLRTYFDGTPITKQNLSEWKTKGGYQDWLLQQNTMHAFQTLNEHAADLEDMLSSSSSTPICKSTLADKLALWLTARYMVLSQQFRSDTLDDDAWKRFNELTRQVIALRRGEHQASRLKLQERCNEFKFKDAQADALEMCLEEAKQFPDVVAQFRLAFNLLKKRNQGDHSNEVEERQSQSNPVQPSFKTPEKAHQNDAPQDCGRVADQPRRAEAPGEGGPQHPTSQATPVSKENTSPHYASRITHHSPSAPKQGDPSSLKDPATRPTCTKPSHSPSASINPGPRKSQIIYPLAK